MKIIVAIFFTLVTLPIILIGFAGSASLFANTGNPAGFLIDAFLVGIVIFIWWGALRQTQRNQTSWTLVLVLAAIGLVLWFYGVDALDYLNQILG